MLCKPFVNQGGKFELFGLHKHASKDSHFRLVPERIAESVSAARLLAATELLTEVSDAQPIVDQQYRYIVETYPETTAANKANSKLK